MKHIELIPIVSDDVKLDASIVVDTVKCLSFLKQSIWNVNLF